MRTHVEHIGATVEQAAVVIKASARRVLSFVDGSCSARVSLPGGEKLKRRSGSQMPMATLRSGEEADIGASPYVHKVELLSVL